MDCLQAYDLIQVDKVSKKFCKNLRKNMIYGLSDLGRDFCGLAPSVSLRSSEFWSLKDISFCHGKGQILGLVGKNGSGKTSLLRLIAGIYPPTTGEIRLGGALASLLAVDVGFHPYMTGRENIYLNALLLGFDSLGLKECMEKIIEYSEIGQFLDTPVSAYSEGMRVKLGFAIAIHRRPQILLVDEVLSIADSGFKKKALDDLRRLKEDCAIIYVSHNMEEMLDVCDRGLLLESSKVILDADIASVISRYRA